MSSPKAAAVMMMVKFCVASGGVPLLAVTVPENVPGSVGMPLITPVELTLNPAGKPPSGRLNVGEPVVVYAKL